MNTKGIFYFVAYHSGSFLFLFGSLQAGMCQAGCISSAESRLWEWWGLPTAPFPPLLHGFPTPKAPQSGLLLSHSHFSELCQMMFNQVTQCNKSKMVMRWMLLLHSLFLSPLILPGLPWITLLKKWQLYVSHNRAVTILAPAPIQHDTRTVSCLTLFDRSIYRICAELHRAGPDSFLITPFSI